MPIRAKHTDKLSLRLSAADKLALQSAADATETKLGDFVVESALARAEIIFSERRTFRLAERWRAFLAALDAPPAPRPRLARLLNEPGVFD
jgi:uncharacterized protein (DUF1778 family)